VVESLRDRKKVVGIKQSMKAIENGEAKLVYVAKDADERLSSKIIDLCKKQNVQVTYVDTMKLLGKACNIDVGAAVACILG
jgi:large subunit ribosomal protein L7A